MKTMRHRIWVILLCVLFMLMALLPGVLAEGKTNGKENQGIPDQIRLIQEELSELRDQVTQQKITSSH